MITLYPSATFKDHFTLIGDGPPMNGMTLDWSNMIEYADKDNDIKFLCDYVIKGADISSEYVVRTNRQDDDECVYIPSRVLESCPEVLLKFDMKWSRYNDQIN